MSAVDVPAQPRMRVRGRCYVGELPPPSADPEGYVAQPGVFNAASAFTMAHGEVFSGPVRYLARRSECRAPWSEAKRGPWSTSDDELVLHFFRRPVRSLFCWLIDDRTPRVFLSYLIGSIPIRTHRSSQTSHRSTSHRARRSTSLQPPCEHSDGVARGCAYHMRLRPLQQLRSVAESNLIWSEEAKVLTTNPLAECTRPTLCAFHGESLVTILSRSQDRGYHSSS